MVSEITLCDPYFVATIHALAQSSFTVEAERIGCADFPPLRETAEHLSASPDRFLIFRECESILAVLSFVCDEGCVTITRLVVSPLHFRRGIAKTMLAELERLIPLAESFAVSTAKANIPAANLYRNHGYTLAGTSHSPEGIALAHFKKSKPIATHRARQASLVI